LFGRLRISIQRLQHPLLLDALQAPLQEIDLQRLLADLALQLGDPVFRPAPLPVAGKSVARPLPGLTPSAVQHVGIHFQRARHLSYRNPFFQPPYRGQLELLGETAGEKSHDSIHLSMDFES